VVLFHHFITKNLDLSVNLPASSSVYTNADDFDPSNPETYNSSTSVTIFDNLGNPVIATAYFIKTQAASGDNVTHKYQTKFIVDGREVEPSLTEAISPTGQSSRMSITASLSSSKSSEASSQPSMSWSVADVGTQSMVP